LQKRSWFLLGTLGNRKFDTVRGKTDISGWGGGDKTCLRGNAFEGKILLQNAAESPRIYVDGAKRGGLVRKNAAGDERGGTTVHQGKPQLGEELDEGELQKKGGGKTGMSVGN